MTKYSLEGVAVVGLGTRLGCLDKDIPEDHPARQLMKAAKDIMILAQRLEAMPSLWKKFPTPSFKKIVHAFDTQWRFVFNICFWMN